MKITAACMAVGLALLLTGCGSKDSESKNAAPEASREMPTDFGMLRIAGGFPGLHARALLFGPRSEKLEIHVPETGGELQFSAYCLNAEESTYEVSIKERTGERLLHSGTAAALTKAEMNEGETLAEIGSAVQVNLDEFKGQTLDLTWRPAAKSATGQFAITALAVCARNSQPDQPPILIICSDAHRTDFAFQDYGPELMPRLNAFARDAVVYERAYSSASWTLPSMVSLFTGLWPLYHKSGARPQPGARLERATTYNSALLAIPEYLHQKGYATYFLHTNPFLYHSSLFSDGFDYALGAAFVVGEDAGRLGKELIERAPQDRPPFVFIHLMDLHQYKAVQFRELFPDVQPEYSDRKSVLAAYGAAAQATDASIGEILDAWDKRFGMADSLVIFCSDHGEHLFDAGHPPITPEEFHAMKVGLHIFLPLLGHGSSMEDVLLRVPLAVKYPEKSAIVPATCATAVSLIDVFPTIVTQLGDESTSLGLQGRPLLPLPTMADSQSRIFHADLQPYADMLSSVRRAESKLVINHTKKTMQLFDMTKIGTDLGEPGAAIEDAAALKEFSEAYQAYEDAAQQFSLLERDSPPQTENLTEDLQKLGYVK